MRRVFVGTLAGAVAAVTAWGAYEGHIVFTSNRDGNPEVYILNAADLSVVRLTNHKGYDDEPSLSPDGATVVFCSNRNGNTELYIVDSDGKDLKRLTDTAYPEADPSFTGDGKGILFTSLVEGDKDIWRYDLATGKSAKFLGGEGDQFMARQAPDGAVVYVQEGDDAGIMLWENGKATKLAASGYIDTMPAFSPDGKLVYFVSNRKGDYDIYVVNRDGSACRELVALPSLEGRPAPSPGGQSLALASDPDGDLELYIFTAAGEKQVQLTENDGFDDYEPFWGK
jgi:TolB protein